MSIDNERTGKPSPYPMGEGCQGQTGQPSQFAHRSGGVSGDGMRGREARVTQETCLRGENASTSGTTSEKKRPFRREQESESLIVVLKLRKAEWSEGGAVVLKSPKQKENGAMARQG